MLQLPKHPRTKRQLSFVRHWLRQLSQAHFKWGYYESTTDAFSPEFIPENGTQEENFCLSFDYLKVKKVLLKNNFSGKY
jgi:hypothetical protein